MSESLEWQSWPLKERPAAGVGAAAVIVLAATGAVFVGQHIAFGLVTLVVLMGSLNPFFSPTLFRMDEEKVVASRWPTRKMRPWEDIRACFVDRNGVTLSPFTKRSWLEPYRGIRLFFRDNRDEVIAYLRAHVREDARFVDLEEAARRKKGGSGGAKAGHRADG